MNVVSLTNVDHSRVKEFFIKHWGSPVMVVSTGVYHCDQLDGLAVIDEDGEIIALLTYVTRDTECEIISLDSIIESKGIGSMLLEAFEKLAREKEIKKIMLVTTNDNIRALQFYQKRGYTLANIIINAVEKARRLKPEIPYVAENGIPIRDEIILEKNFSE